MLYTTPDGQSWTLTGKIWMKQPYPNAIAYACSMEGSNEIILLPICQTKNCGFLSDTLPV